MTERIFGYIQKIEDMGGLVSAVENGWLHREISNYNRAYQKKIESGEMKVVGVNFLKAAEQKACPVEVYEYPEAYTRQKERLDRLRKKRNSRKVQACLDKLKEKCHSNENLYPYCIEAVKNLVTLGEIQAVFREEFGLWSFPLIT